MAEKELKGKTLEKRVRQARTMLTNESKKAFGKGKYDKKTGSLVSDDKKWRLKYNKKTQGVHIEK